jgi:hypothetical protein
MLFKSETLDSSEYSRKVLSAMEKSRKEIVRSLSSTGATKSEHVID